MNQDSNAEIIMVDLTCRTPPYDRCLCEALESEGMSVDLWAAGCHGDSLYRSELDVSRPLDLMAHLSGTPWLTKRLKALEYFVNLLLLYIRLWLRPIPVIHFQWLPFLDVGSLELPVVKLIQKQGTKVVYTVHDLLPLDGSGGEEERRRYSAVYRQVDALICHTKTSKKKLVDEFGVDSSKIWHIPHGPLSPAQNIEDGDCETPTPRAEAVTGVNEDVPTVVLFGVLRPYKGYDFLLRTWAQIENQVDARLVIVGSASEQVQEEIEGLIQEEEIAGSVSRTYRYVSDAELRAVISAASILVYPYRNITQSGALFTGMEAGKAIVATNVGGLGETIRNRETGRLVEFGNHDQLATVLAELLADPERCRRLGKAARHDLRTRLSWTEIAEQTRECYRAVADET